MPLRFIWQRVRSDLQCRLDRAGLAFLEDFRSDTRNIDRLTTCHIEDSDVTFAQTNPFELPPSRDETMRQVESINGSCVLVEPQIEAVFDCRKMRVAIRSRNLSIILFPITSSS